MSPLGAEWGHVAVTEDLMQASRDLAQLAWEFRQEGRGWTVGGMREALEDRARTLTGWAQEAALESSRGDYYSRLEALQRAHERIRAATGSLRHVFEAGELWNSHRVRPVPASLKREIEGWAPTA